MRNRMRAQATLSITLCLVPACSNAQTPPLPACEWCGAAEAPAELDWHTTIAPESEPGRRLALRGVVYQSDGITPAPDVLLYFYHTNAAGVYATRGDETGNGRRHGYLRGWVRTDDRGRYEIRTIRPGSYPGRETPAHIHATVLEPDGTPEYWIDQFLFADDPFLDREDGDAYILDPEPGDDGVLRAEQDIVLPARDDRGGGGAVEQAATGSHLGVGARLLCADTTRSVVRWRGTKIGGSHEGTVPVRSGWVAMEGADVTDGEFIVDMTGIAVTDIPADQPEPRRQLASHLSHEEFFAADRFPTARLVVRGASMATGGMYHLTGDLTIRDSTHTVTFQARPRLLRPDSIHAVAELNLDRQRWGVRFDGTTSALRNAIVHNTIQLGITVVASRERCR